MANGIVAAAVNRQSVALALTAARTEAAEHKAWINAINRAAMNLEACRWQFDGEVLRIESATKSNSYYLVSADGCPCQAGGKGKPCWHRAARRLLCKAAEMAKPKTVVYKGFAYTPAQQVAAAEARKAAGYIDAKVQAEADEMFA
jgi:hypothetical protein